jgi:hypothetical protein
VPLPAKPALHWHVDALAPLELLAGQELQMLAPAALKEPAKHARVTQRGPQRQSWAVACVCVCVW